MLGPMFIVEWKSGELNHVLSRIEPIERLAIGRPMRIAPVSLVKRSHVTAAPRILQAAEDCFGEHGIDAVSLRQIAIAAGQGHKIGRAPCWGRGGPYV